MSCGGEDNQFAHFPRIYLIHYRASDWINRSVATIPVKLRKRVTVINNGPAEELQLDAEGIGVIHIGRNVGFAAAANLGLRDLLKGNDSHCIIASHDVLFEEIGLQNLWKVAREYPDFGIIGPTLSNNFMAPLSVGGNEICERQMVSGGCMMLSRGLIRQIGILDEEYFLYGEDNDICHRAALGGWKIGTVNSVVFETLGTKRKSSKNFRSSEAKVIFSRKHFSKIDTRQLVFRLLKSAFKYGASGQIAKMFSSFRGIYSGLTIRLKGPGQC